MAKEELKDGGYFYICGRCRRPSDKTSNEVDDLEAYLKGEGWAFGVEFREDKVFCAACRKVIVPGKTKEGHIIPAMPDTVPAPLHPPTLAEKREAEKIEREKTAAIRELDKQDGVSLYG